MKNSILLISIMLSSVCISHAQALWVTYEKKFATPKYNLDQIEDPLLRQKAEEQVKEQLSKMDLSEELLINNGVSIYKPEANNRRGNSSIIREGTHTIYRNQKDSLLIRQASFEGKDYLIEEPLKELRWKIGRKEQEVSGYRCIEATTVTDKGAPIRAWYTPDIPVNEGPMSFWGLPGLILYVDFNNGMYTLSCTSIEQIDNSTAISPPDKGEKISKEQFDKLSGKGEQRQSVTIRTETIMR